MTRLSARGATIATAVAALAAVAVLAAGCGVPLDSSPRPISRTSVVSGAVSGRETPTTSASPTAIDVAAFFLRDETLVAGKFRIGAAPTLPDVLAFVFGDPPPGLTTSIPAGTRLISVKVAGRVATIDLSSHINDVSGQSQKQAYAQIVFTALRSTQVPGRQLEAVQFEVEGKAVDAPTDNGNRNSVTQADYRGPLRPDE